MTTPETAPIPRDPVRVPKRRDRHGRGLRGALIPTGLPAARTKAQAFEAQVHNTARRIFGRLPEPLREKVRLLGLVVQDVPPLTPGEEPDITLADLLAANDDEPERVVVYRRPVEARVQDVDELSDVLHVLVVEQVARALGVSATEVDPDWPDEDN